MKYTRPPGISTILSGTPRFPGHTHFMHSPPRTLSTCLALLAKAVYNIVDTAYIGMLDSDIALAAVGVTLPLLLIMVSIENIFAAGASDAVLP